LVDQLEVGLVDEGRRGERVSRPLAAQMVVGDVLQFGIDEGEQFVIKGAFVTLGLRQDCRNSFTYVHRTIYACYCGGYYSVRDVTGKEVVERAARARARSHGSARPHAA
jgi:hypothetical protein